jgi:maltoporin
MKFKSTLLAAAALTALSTSASAVDWGGYVRVGPGQKENSGDGKRCFDGGSFNPAGDKSPSAAPGHGGLGRLGNECHTYGEFALSQGLKAGGVDYKATLMTNFSSAGGSSASGLTQATQQIYIEGKGYDIAPNQTFWIGERFYHRADVHFDDSFYINMSGTGAGVDGIKVGGGSLGVALFRSDDAAAGGNPGSRLNVDLEGLSVNPGGKLRLTAAITKFSGTGGQNGTGLSLQHNQSGVLGGDNVLWLQWAKGSASTNMGFGDGAEDSNHKVWRIADSLAWTNGPLTAQTLLHYGRAQAPNGIGGTDTVTTTSIGGRLGYAVSRNFKIQGELGTANTKPDGASKQSVTKFTIAPTLTVGPNYYDRPELRFYVSTFSMNDAYAAANGQTKKSKSAAGFQAEVWF